MLFLMHIGVSIHKSKNNYRKESAGQQRICIEIELGGLIIPENIQSKEEKCFKT
jgi:hypothetical protein